MQKDDNTDDKPRYLQSLEEIAPIFAALFMLSLLIMAVYFFYFRTPSPFEVLFPKEKPVQYEPKPIQGMMPATAVTPDGKEIPGTPAAQPPAAGKASPAPQQTPAKN